MPISTRRSGRETERLRLEEFENQVSSSKMTGRSIFKVIPTTMVTRSADVFYRAMFKNRQVMTRQAHRVFFPRQWRRKRWM